MNLIGSVLVTFLVAFSFNVKAVKVYPPPEGVSSDFKREANSFLHKQVDPDLLNTTIKLMILRYNLSNVTVEFKDGVLSFYPQPKLFIKDIVIYGNYRLSRDEILRVIPYTSGDEWRPYYASLIKERIKNLAEKKGLFECSVKVNFDRKTRLLKIDIFEGPPYWIFKIHLDEGKKEFLWLLNDLVGKEYSDELISGRIEHVTRYLMKRGYLNPRVELRICRIDRTIKAVTLCAVLVPGYKISVRFKGNKYISSEELYFMLGLNKLERLSPGVVEKKKKIIEKFYYSHCFPLVKVKVITKIKGDRKEYLFWIREGPHTGISRVVIRGVKFYSPDRIISLMDQKPYSFPLKLVLKKCYNPEELDTDMEIIKNFYVKNGFLDVRIEKKELKYISGKLTIFIKIDEGRRYLFYKTVVTGSHFFSNGFVAGFIKLKRGDPLNPFLIEKACEKLTLLYRNSGFKDASVRYSLSTTDPERTVVDLIINEGKRYFWGEVFVSGNRKVDRKFILEKVGVVPGRPFSQEEYYMIYSRLYETGYFKRVRLNMLSYGNTIDLIVNVKEQPSNLVDLSFSLGTQEGVSLDLKFSTWYFLGGIRSLTIYNKTEYDYASFRELFTHLIPPSYGVLSLLYKEPISARKNLDLQIFTNWERNTKYTEYSYSMRKIGVGLNRKFRKRVELTSGINFDYYNFFDVNEENFVGPRKFFLGYLNLVFLRDSRNDIFMPTSGNYQLISIEYGTSWLLSEFDYIRYKGSFAWYWSFLKNSMELVLRVGEVYSAGSPLYLPDVLKFYLGGAYSLRGYKSDSIKASLELSPEVSIPMGGVSMFDYQLDFNFPLYGNFEWVVFNDGGNVWAKNFFEGITPRLKFGAGWGIKYKTPLGPLTFNVGYPIAQENGIAPYQLYFFIKTFL